MLFLKWMFLFECLKKVVNVFRFFFQIAVLNCLTDLLRNVRDVELERCQQMCEPSSSNAELGTMCVCCRLIN